MADGVAALNFLDQAGQKVILVEAPGAKLTGAGNVFKRVTSIAQAVPDPNNPGRFKGGYVPSSAASFEVFWAQAALGTSYFPGSVRGLHLWGEAGNDIDPTKDCIGGGVDVVQVTSAGAGSELITIDFP